MSDPSISRREALAGAAVAAGTVLLNQVALAQEPVKPFTFALISDTHLGRNGDEPAKQMKQAIDQINASPAELTICCGDLVNAGDKDANEKHYGEWRKLASEWKNPWQAVPGNHDPLPRFTKHIHGATDFVVDHPGYRFICFRDALPNPEHFGAVLDEQLQWLQKQIDTASEQQRRVFLVSHIIYHRNDKPDVGWWIRDNREAFGDFLKQNARTITAFFAGHFHSGLRGWSDSFNIHEVVLPSVCWNFNGKRLRRVPGYAFDEDRPGWVLAEVTADRLKLSYKPLEADVSVVKEVPVR